MSRISQLEVEFPRIARSFSHTHRQQVCLYQQKGNNAHCIQKYEEEADDDDNSKVAPSGDMPRPLQSIFAPIKQQGSRPIRASTRPNLHISRSAGILEYG